MKIAIEINDELLRQARDVVQHDRVTLASLIEQGLRMVLKSRGASPVHRRTEPVVFHGKLGFTPEFEGKKWGAFKEDVRYLSVIHWWPEA